MCTRAHQIGALALVAVTFVLTRSLDRLSSFPNSNSSPYYSSSDLFHAGALNWPQRGYGDSIELRIYVYDESEIDGLRELMRGRDDRITPQACVKGQWGTQVTSISSRSFEIISYINMFLTWQSKMLHCENLKRAPNKLDAVPAKLGIGIVLSGMQLKGAVVYDMCEISGQNS